MENYRIFLIIILIIALIPIISSENSEDFTEWRMFHKYLNHTAWDGVNFPIKALNRANYTTGEKVLSAPIVANGFVYVTSFDGYLYQLNASDISQRINRYGVINIGGGSGSPIYYNGSIFVGDYNGYLYQFNASNVSIQIANYSTGSRIEVAPAVYNGSIYFTTANKYIYQLNASNISQLFNRYSISGFSFFSSPAVADGYVYVGTSTNFYQFNASNVSQQVKSLASGVISSPAVADGFVYVGSDDTHIYQLNASDSTTIKSYTAGSLVRSSPAVANGFVYVSSNDGQFYQLNASDVSQLIYNYSIPNSGEIYFSSPVVANGFVYIGSTNFQMYQFNASNISQKIATYNTSGKVISSPAYANGYIYFGSYDNRVYQLNASNISLDNPHEMNPPVFYNWTTNNSRPLYNSIINFTVNVTDDTQVSTAFLSHNLDVVDKETQSQLSFNDYASYFGSYYSYGQTFRFSSSGYLREVCFNISRTGNAADNVYINLYNTVGGLPTGSNLTAPIVIINNSLPLSVATTLVCKNFSNLPYLIGNVTYALTLTSPNTMNIIYKIAYGYYTFPNPYTGGRMLYSSNSGNNYTYYSYYDLAFKFTLGMFDWKNETNINVNSPSKWITNLKRINYWSNTASYNYKWCAYDVYNNFNCTSNQNFYIYDSDVVIDNILPSAGIYSPPNGTKVNGNVLLDGFATDNIAMDYASMQYMNSSVGWTNLTGCDKIYAPYDCIWNSTAFNNNTGGYDIRIVPCDTSQNCNYSTITRHYVIDRNIPYDVFYVIYPTNQSSIRNTQSIIFKLNITDGSGAGMNDTGVLVDLTSLNTTAKNWSMSLESGSPVTGSYSFWNISIPLVGTTTQLLYNKFYAFDNATPTNNLLYNTFPVQIDNNAPTYGNVTLSESGTIYNNTDVIFTLPVYDNLNLSYFIFSSNFSGSWLNSTKIYFTNLIETEDLASYNTTVNAGNFSYLFYIFDDAGNMNTTITTYLNISVEAPATDINVYLHYPSQGSSYDEGNITFSFNYTGVNADSCGIYLSGLLIKLYKNPTINVETNFSYNLTSGNYFWDVKCNNTLGTMFFSTTNEFSVSLPQIIESVVTGGSGGSIINTQEKFSIQLKPHYYLNGKEIPLILYTQAYDSISFDISAENDYDFGLRNLTLLEAYPSLIKNYTTIIPTDLSGKKSKLLWSTKPIPLNLITDKNSTIEFRVIVSAESDIGKLVAMTVHKEDILISNNQYIKKSSITNNLLFYLIIFLILFYMGIKSSRR